MIQELKKEDVYRKTIIKPVFGEMDDLPSFNEPLIKQEKAREAIDFGLSIDKPGCLYNPNNSFACCAATQSGV